MCTYKGEERTCIVSQTVFPILYAPCTNISSVSIYELVTLSTPPFHRLFTNLPRNSLSTVLSRKEIYSLPPPCYAGSLVIYSLSPILVLYQCPRTLSRVGRRSISSFHLVRRRMSRKSSRFILCLCVITYSTKFAINHNDARCLSCWLDLKEGHVIQSADILCASVCLMHASRRLVHPHMLFPSPHSVNLCVSTEHILCNVEHRAARCV